MYKKSGAGYVLVESDATHKVGTGRKGVDGKEIIVDIAFNPVEYAYNFATVTQTPVRMPKTPIGQIPAGSPGYGPIRRPVNMEESCSMDLYAIGGVYQYRYVSDIHPDVAVGDRIYFKKRTLNSKINQMGALLGEDRKPYKYFYKVPYENIYCAVKVGGLIVPIGSWVLLEPIVEDWKDIYHKTYYDFKDEHGNPIERPKDQWIKMKLQPDTDNMRAKVAHIGKPLKGDPCEIKRGDVVVFKKQKNMVLNEIEGVKYLVLPQDQILGQLLEDVKIS
jgi:co-chaperonin GroES (HSP10)